MRVLYEPNLEGVDYLEIILTSRDIEDIKKAGLAQDYKEGLHKETNLNIFIRIDHAIS